MDSLKPQLPKINNEDRTPLVDVLLELLAWQEIQIDKLEQEILKLKGETTKPKIKPSKMDEDSAEDGAKNGDDGDKSKKNKGPKRSKTEHLKIDATVNIHPDTIPEGSTFKGYRKVVIQNINKRPSTPAIAWPNTKHRMAATSQDNSPMGLTAATLATI